MATVAQMRAKNFDMMLRDGPRLRYDYNTWVEAKDTKSNKVLIGGLGGLGIGIMWFPMGKRHKKLPGFNEAPEKDAPPDYAYTDYADVVGTKTDSGFHLIVRTDSDSETR